MKPLKILSRIGLVLLAAVAVLLVVRAALNFTEGRKLSRALADLKAQGVPLTMQELVGACPDGENGATLWKAAEELVSVEREDVKLLADIHQKIMGGLPVAPEDWPAVSQLIDKNRKAMDLLPEIAGISCFQYGDRQSRFWDRKIPNAVKMMRTVRLLGLEALRTAEEGDLAGSLDRLRTGLGFAPKLAQESSLIAYLIALANVKTCLLFLNRSLAGREAGEDLLLKALGELDGRRVDLWRTLFKTSIRGERVALMDVGLYLDAKEWASGDFLKGRAERLYFWLIRPLIKRDVRLNLPNYAELETRAMWPYYRTRDFWRAYNDHLERLPWYALASKLVIPQMEASFMKVATLEALILTARAGLACRIFKARTGQYPETLAALIPDLLSEMPIDPFTGDPLVYRRDGEGFIVYSLGSNQKDDGGRSTYMITQLVMDKDDDWSWKENK